MLFKYPFEKPIVITTKECEINTNAHLSTTSAVTKDKAKHWTFVNWMIPLRLEATEIDLHKDTNPELTGCETLREI